MRKAVVFSAAVILMIAVLFIYGRWMELSLLHVNVETFEESPRFLQNPNRGFYRIYAFCITDQAVDYAAEVDRLYSGDDDTTLALIEVNLMEYRTGDISQAGLENIDALFKALSNKDKQLIVRFLYDLEGNNLLTEPDSLDIILRHMEQLRGVFHRSANSIFTLQGLFVGDWGELHNTRYESAEDLRRLAQKLAEVSTSRLSVRTPAQWRTVTLDGTDPDLTPRLGLFNDGILGSDSDLGTYRLDLREDPLQSRAEALAFQEALCRSVPNGGEVVIDNPFNDFENAARDLSSMHVTYLNKDYDLAVMEKWAAATVSESGCYHGMDGLSYIERHLGYRLLISGVRVEHNIMRQQLTIEAAFRNEGFAPLYEEPEMTVSVRDMDGAFIGEYPAEHCLRTLSGGPEREKTAAVQVVIPTRELVKGTCKVYLTLKDPGSGREILLANTQDSGPYGYCLGEIEVYR